MGNYVVRELLRAKHSVTVLDNLDPQVHAASGNGAQVPDGAVFYRGDLNDPEILLKVLKHADAVAHLGAVVGVGQSMYEVSYYTHNNVNATGRLYETIIKNKLAVKKIVVASSMSAYGEGLYRCTKCRKTIRGGMRSEAKFKKGSWELDCPVCKKPMTPVPIPETEPFAVSSIYALTKRDTEEIALMLGAAHNIPSVALRFFNIYGPGQSLSNPYTGVAAIFFSRVLNLKPPVVYEDGLQSRDFVHASDVARAVRLALESDVKGQVFNVGGGERVTIREIADTVLKVCGKEGAIKPQVTGQYRKGDIRHCFADTAKIKKALGWKTAVLLNDGFQELYYWAQKTSSVDRFDQASQELEHFNLLAKAK